MTSSAEGQRDFRLIVTGSRDYDDHLSLRTALNRIFDSLPSDTVLVVIVGGEHNPDDSTQADRIAQEWALEMAQEGLPVRLESHPADWEAPCRPECDHGGRVTRRGRSICPAAGPYRNAEMVASLADFGLGALRSGAGNKGTKDCLTAMFRAGIQFEIVVQGKGAGLPEHLIRGKRDQ